MTLTWRIEYSDTAKKALSKLDKHAAVRITSFLADRVLALANPRDLGAALTGSRLGNFWRYRVGDYRIVCDLRDGVLRVLVLDIGHRREIYR